MIRIDGYYLYVYYWYGESFATLRYTTRNIIDSLVQGMANRSLHYVILRDGMVQGMASAFVV